MSAVGAEKEAALKKRMKELGISEDDFTESFILGSGKGGQKVQKTSSCVQLVHEESGIIIRCQRTRSQALNRYYARVLLCEKIAQLLHNEKTKRDKEREKVRRQKQRRSRRTRAKMRADKEHLSVKKTMRKTVKDPE